MTPLNLAIVGLRLMAVYLYIQSGMFFIQAFSMADFLIQEHQFDAQIFVSVVPVIGCAILASVLFFCQPGLARRLISPVCETSKDTAWSLEDIQGIAFAAVGLVILSSTFTGIGRALSEIYLWFKYSGDPVAAENHPPINWLYACGIFTEFLLGLFLVLNPHGFRNAWHWLRTAGTRPNPE